MESQGIQQIDKNWRSKAKDYIIRRLKCFIYQQTHPPAELFFTLYLLKTLNVLHFDMATNQIILLITVIVTVFTNCNPYFFYASSLESLSPIWQLLSLILGILAVNERYKVYLFLFIINNSPFDILQHESTINQYQILISVVISFEIYRSLVFDTIRNNKKYFVGFFLIASQAIIIQIVRIFQIEINFLAKWSALLMLLILSYLLINHRINNIKITKLNQLKNPRQIHYHILLNTTVQNSVAFLKNHIEDCQDLVCFCAKYQHYIGSMVTNINKQLQKNLTHYLYLQALNLDKWSHNEKKYLKQKYADYMIERGQIITAIKLLSNFSESKMNYFLAVQNFRIWEKIKQNCNEKSYFKVHKKKFQTIYQYDLKIGYMNKEIRQILWQKIQFWKQIGYPAPRLQKLQEYGLSLVKKIQNLNNFYLNKVQPIQQQLLNFNCTMMYASYLLMATNYTEFAEILLKSTQNILSDISLDNYIDSYGIQTVPEQEHQRTKSAINFLKIVNISGQLAEQLNKTKRQMINQEITAVIPDYFVEIHDVGFNKWINLSGETQSETAFEQILELPFKINKETIIYMNFTARLKGDLYSSKIYVQAIVYKKTNNAKNFLVNMDGKILMKQEQTEENLFQSEEVIQSIALINESVKSGEKIHQKILHIDSDTRFYQITLSLYFDHHLQYVNKQPVIRVKVENQNMKKKIKEIQKFDFLVQNKKQMQSNTVSDSDSQASISSRKDTIQSIVIILHEKNWFKQQKTLTIFLFFVFVISGAIIMIEISIIDIHNNINSLRVSKTISQITILMIKTIAWKKDLILLEKFQQQGDQQFEGLLKLITLDVQFELFCRNKFQQLSKNLRFEVSSYILGKQDQISSKRREAFEKLIQVENNYPYPEIKSIETSIQSILLIIITQIGELNKYQFNQTLISKMFLSVLCSQLSQIRKNINTALDEDFKTKQRNNIIACCLIIVVFIFLSIPYWKIIKKYKVRGTEVFNILAALSPSLISNQITKLQEIDMKMLIFNCKHIPIKKKEIIIPSEKIEKESTLKQSSKYNNVQLVLVEKFALELMNKKKSNNDRQSMRTRSGDIDVQNSTGDPKKVSIQQSIFYVFLLSFIIWALVIILVQLNALKSFKQFKKNIEYQLEQQQTDNYQLLLTKMYFDEYTPQTKITFLEKDIKAWIYDTFTQQYLIQPSRLDQQKYIQILKCDDLDLICSQDYSVAILRGMVQKSVYDNYNIKTQILQAQMRNQNYTRFNLVEIRSELSFAQLVSQRIHKITHKQIDQAFLQLKQKENNMKNHNQLLAQIFWVNEALFLIYSVSLLIMVKNKYATNITILSFLNKDMVFKNKRVESYVNRLSKELR